MKICLIMYVASFKHVGSYVIVVLIIFNIFMLLLFFNVSLTWLFIECAY